MNVEVNLIGSDKLKKQIGQLLKVFEQETRKVVLTTALVDIETYMKENAIPVDTGRLRSSIHTKFKSGMVAGIQPTSETYKDDQGNVFDGRLDTSIDLNSVVVGTNVEYAKKINREGGGGNSSKRTDGGKRKAKGYGQGFFDKAVKHGEIVLQKELEKLVEKAGDLI